MTRHLIKSLTVLALILLALTACQSDPPTPTVVPSLPVTAQPAQTATVPSTPTQEVAMPTQDAPPPTRPGTQPAPTQPSATPPAVQEGQVGAAGLGDPYDPLLGNGGYDAQHYTLDLVVDVAGNVISGTTTIRASATQDLIGFNLDLIGLTVSQIWVNDEPAGYARDSTRRRELVVTPQGLLPQGETFTVTVAYHGTPETIQSRAIPITLGWQHYDGGIFVASEPEGAAGWYPVNDHPQDKATYTFNVTVPEPYVVAANGVLEEVIDHGVTSTYVWQADHPIASYLVTVNIADYVIDRQEGPDGLPIRNFFHPDLAEEAAYDFGRAGEMIAFYSDLFGPYPFDAYGVALVTDVSFALETQTLSIFGANSVTGRREVEPVAAHELVHQWFGDSVSPAFWHDIWLNEGFATYGQLLWEEHDEGPQRFEESVRFIYGALSGANLPPHLEDAPREEIERELAAQYPPPGDPPSNDLFNGGIYLRGAMTLHALRLRVGDEIFFDILRTYHDRYRYGTASTADLISVAEEVSGQELDEFFEAWLYDPVVPDIPEMGLSVDLGSDATP